MISIAKQNQTKVLKQLANLGVSDGLLYLNGNKTENRKWTDAELPFRQESNFWYLTGCNEHNFSFALDIKTKETTMFIPVYDPDHALWSGAPPTVDQVKQVFQVTNCLTESSLKSFLDKYSAIHVVSKAELSHSASRDDVLPYALAEARMVKSEGELELMRKASIISANAHVALMKEVKRAYKSHSERSLASLFSYECSKQGGHVQAYGSIVGAGTRGAILHSSPISTGLTNSPEDFVLVDAGCEYECYASDITRTFPFGGVFQGDYRTIYEIVLEANKAVIASLKPGIQWESMHRLAEDVILKGLVKAGIVHGTEEELKKNHVAALFFPHGLGHLLGLDVHDTPLAAYPKGVERIPEPGIKYLRMRRKLEPGMVVTVEPGLYFVDAILDQALANPSVAKLINIPVLERFKRVGGVRIEDDVVIHENRVEVLTTGVPKEIAEIEALMK